jgi:hypothetical protein
MLDVNRGNDGLTTEEPLSILGFETCTPAIFKDQLNNSAVRQDSAAMRFDNPHDRVRQLAGTTARHGPTQFLTGSDNRVRQTARARLV